MTADIDNVVPLPVLRTCFRCSHYLENYCRLFDEQIDSEIYAAKNCAGFEVED